MQRGLLVFERRLSTGYGVKNRADPAVGQSRPETAYSPRMQAFSICAVIALLIASGLGRPSRRVAESNRIVRSARAQRY